MKLSASDFIRLAHFFAHDEGTCLLLSGGDGETAGQSFLGLFPLEEVRISSAESSINPWDALKAHLKFRREGTNRPQWMGFLTYEMGAFSDEEVLVPLKSNDFLNALFYRYGVVLSFNQETHEFIAHVDPTLSQTAYQASSFKDLLDREPPKPLSFPKPGGFAQKPWSLEQYVSLVHQIKEHILWGDIYQANLSQRFLLEGHWDPFSTFVTLHGLNPAPFSAYLNGSTFHVVSSSPERFLSHKNGRLETRPIKGTVKRGATVQEGLTLLKQLLRSEKNKAELLMITDLMRHDLGGISEVGTVHVRDIWRPEVYANVFHLLSVIESRARPDLHPVDLVRACFPGGSITGCPKIRAMEIIQAAEGRSRGVYTGCMGYFAENGDFDFNIAIRTLFLRDNTVEVQLGGAIVADSDPVAEYEETLVKGASIMRALQAEDLWACEAVS